MLLIGMFEDDADEEEEEEDDEEEEEQEEEEEEPGLATLNKTSLMNLAAAVGSDGLRLAMCLNVPTTALIQIQFQGLDSGWDLDSIISNMLFYWKLMRRTVKDRDKVCQLSRIRLKSHAFASTAVVLFPV